MLTRYAPKSLYLRVILIVAIPIFITQAIVTYIFFDRHWDKVSANLSNNVSGQIALVTDLYVEETDPEKREQLIAWAQKSLDLQVRYDVDRQIPAKDRLSPFNAYNNSLNRRLRRRVQRPYWFDTQSWRDYVEVRVEIPDGQLVYLVLRQRTFATSGPIFLFWLIGISALLGWIATIFMRNQVKSILRLARAAEAFGRGRDTPDFRPSGATEVRKAGYAFIAMRERIKRHLEQRTHMLAGVSHDLRTPLTRIKLGLAIEKETPEIKDLRNDVLEMERMVEAYLDFARNEAADEEPDRFNLTEMLEEILSGATRSGGTIILEPGRTIDIFARRTALRRAVDNLVSNALRYGSVVHLCAKSDETHISIIVDDDGPGIPEDRAEDVFKPFVRLDEARSLNEVGVGMGLTIVRDVARSHGGRVYLLTSPLGGLRATIELPL